MRIRHIGTTLILSMTFSLVSAVQAMEDPVTATPGMYKILHENDQIRVLELVYQPGQRENWHGHPRYLVYVVEPGDGKIKVENDKGEVHEYDLKLGQNLLTGPVEKHRGMNPGSSPIRLLAIELKQER
jgi:mannose-6-phosphate isomerase-like protein (cupin superfamily)